ncbi:DUF2269 family protein [Sutcliffiella rhizosphaerae]|uniref:DUF2269 family protein n=1 Tax=Sutcliffiella rhizosphaerae TaxID=2880967 RepID=A0ABM8YL75_9BACI|nr:DUF2269 family protein [Sutcliffiella rhizosphaerae]CAG9620603.1 hypothetical protein BACCIP111883_01372 [Sutcliffiella rhizosphaerae]
MKWLVLIHVMVAIIGFGPTFFGNILLRKHQTISDLRHNVLLQHKLDYFPKIAGTLAVITGILLVLTGNYGSILQVWLLGSLILYLAIQFIIIGFISPSLNVMQRWLFNPDNRASTQLPPHQTAALHKINNLYCLTTFLAFFILVLMIMKPS